MVLAIAIVVVNRFVFKVGIVWGEPVVLLFMTYVSLVSAALGIRRDTHIRMELVDSLFPIKFVRVLRAIAQIGIFAFGAFMLRYGWEFALIAGRNTMTGVGISSFWLYLACPIMGLAICIMEIERVINFFYRRKLGLTLDDVLAQEKALAGES
jgi:TRAP-type C4-dicarboxylate transport system permease small subunit